MASAAQVYANIANASLSTGPKTAEGKARSSRNNLRHGLSLGVLALIPPIIGILRVRSQTPRGNKPEGMMEEEALRQLLDGAWRLRKIRALVDSLIARYDEDIFVHPDTEAEMRQLTRYRAAAEMLVYRSIKTLRELQSLRLFRAFHLTKDESDALPPLVHPGQKIIVGGVLSSVADRKRFYRIHGEDQFSCRFPPAIHQSEPNAATSPGPSLTQ